MAGQYYPSVDQLLEVLMSEMPAGVFAEDYADDPDPAKRSYSSSELRAAMSLLATLYQNMSLVAKDKDIGTATESGIARWEYDLFKGAQSGGDVETRRQALLAKLGASGGISRNAIEAITSSILTPKGLAFEILTWSGGLSSAGRQSAWVLDVSALGHDTFLSSRDPLIANRTEGGLVPLDNKLNYVAAGISETDLIETQMTAYTYEVMIFGVADQATLESLDRQLTMYEPARSGHVITNNASTGDEEPVLYRESFPWRV